MAIQTPLFPLVVLQSDTMALRYSRFLQTSARMIMANDPSHFCEMILVARGAIGILGLEPGLSAWGTENPLLWTHRLNRQTPAVVLFAVGGPCIAPWSMQLYQAGFTGVFTSFSQIDQLVRSACKHWHRLAKPRLPVEHSLHHDLPWECYQRPNLIRQD